jgi:hypothetical protein
VVLNTALDLQVVLKVGNFLSSSASGIFSRAVLLGVKRLVSVIKE